MTKYTLLPDAAIWQKLKRSGSPVQFSLELTARCNNQCRHCYINMPADDKTCMAQELTIEEIDRIADEAVELGVLWCFISGGEPLLRSDFEEIYLLLKKKGLLISIYTNATLIRSRHIHLFKKHAPRDIEVTVYGAADDTYDKVTGRPGAFKQFKHGLDLLLKNKVPVRLKAMAIRSNLHEHEKIAEFCRKHTKDYYRFDPFLNLRTDGDSSRNQGIIRERLTAAEIVTLERSDTDRLSSLRRSCSKLDCDDHCGLDCDHLFHCGLGIASFDISYNGQFRLCGCLTAPGTTFDLRNGNLHEAWQFFVKKIRSKTSQNKEYLEKCKPCSIRNLCFWCPAMAYLETGELDQWVEYFCEVAHARAELVYGKQQIPTAK